MKMCSVIEIKNSDEYNIYYQSPESLEKSDKSCKPFDLHPIYESHTEKDFSLEEFGSYHFIKESKEDSILFISSEGLKSDISDTSEITISGKNKDEKNKIHIEVKPKISNGKRGLNLITECVILHFEY